MADYFAIRGTPTTPSVSLRQVKMMNFAIKARNFVSKTRNCVFKMMNFAGPDWRDLQLQVCIENDEFCIENDEILYWKWWMFAAPPTSIPSLRLSLSLTFSTSNRFVLKMMNFSLKMMKFFIENGQFCIKNDELCTKMMDFVLKMMKRWTDRSRARFVFNGRILISYWGILISYWKMPILW